MKITLNIITASILGIIILFLSGFFMMIISEKTNMFILFPAFGKMFTHISMIVFSILIILLINNGRLNEYGFVWCNKFQSTKTIFISLILGALASIIKMVFLKQETINVAGYFSWYEKIIYIWILASIAEEVLARGFIQGYLSPFNHLGIQISNYFISLPVIVGALFFGAMHFMLFKMGLNILSIILIVTFAVILGLIAGYQREKTNSLVPAIIVHFCFNVGASVLSIF